MLNCSLKLEDPQETCLGACVCLCVCVCVCVWQTISVWHQVGDSCMCVISADCPHTLTHRGIYTFTHIHMNIIYKRWVSQYLDLNEESCRKWKNLSARHQLIFRSSDSVRTTQTTRRHTHAHEHTRVLPSHRRCCVSAEHFQSKLHMKNGSKPLNPLSLWRLLRLPIAISHFEPHFKEASAKKSGLK